MITIDTPTSARKNFIHRNDELSKSQVIQAFANGHTIIFPTDIYGPISLMQGQFHYETGKTAQFLTQGYLEINNQGYTIEAKYTHCQFGQKCYGWLIITSLVRG